MKFFWVILAVILCAMTLFAGCTARPQPSADTSAGETAAPMEAIETPQALQLSWVIEPELLISKDEAAQLVGRAVKDGEKMDMESVGQKIVFYDPADGGTEGFLQISLTQQSAMPAGSTISPDEIYGAAKEGLEDSSDVQISGIGDDCFTGTPGLHILAEGYYIVVGAGNTENEAVHEILRKAGGLAVQNLKKILAGQ